MRKKHSQIVPHTPTITCTPHNTLSNKPIGVFDSGAGGLSIARAIRAELPRENLLYLADTTYAPYGNKPTDLILKRSESIARYLIDLGAKLIVIACNTATVTAVQHLRSCFEHTATPCPIVGVEPGIKLAQRILSESPNQSEQQSSQPKPIAILATQNTLNSISFRKLMITHSSATPIILQPCPGFVELVESGHHTGIKAIKTVQAVLKPLLLKHVNTFVLGCTHFDFLAETILKVAEKPIHLIQTHGPVAKHVAKRLQTHNLLSSTSLPRSPVDRFFCTANGESKCLKQEEIYTLLWGESLSLEPASLF